MGTQDPNFDPLQGQTPDYGGYGLDALFEVRRRIDADTYPDRAMAVDREISTRLNQPVYRRLTRKRYPVRLAKRAVAAAQVLGGMFGSIGVLSYVWSLAMKRPTWSVDTVRTFGILAGFLALYVLTIVAGRLLWRFRPVGTTLSTVMLALQMFHLRWLTFEYVFAIPGSLMLYLPTGEVTFRFGIICSLGWAVARQPFSMGVNFASLAMLGALTYYNAAVTVESAQAVERPV